MTRLPPELAEGMERLQQATDGLKQALRMHAYVKGDFVLASGRQASYYVDVSRISLQRRCFDWIGTVVAFVTGVSDAEAVGGPLAGAAPLVCAGLSRGVPLGFFVRDGHKDHGVGERIVGKPAFGTRCLIVDDVVSTGATIIQAAEVCAQEGLVPVAAYSLVDRGKDAEKLIADELDIPYNYMTTMCELGIERD